MNYSGETFNLAFNAIIRANFPRYAAIMEIDGGMFMKNMVELIVKDPFENPELTENCYKEAVDYILEMDFTDDQQLAFAMVQNRVQQRHQELQGADRT